MNNSKRIKFISTTISACLILALISIAGIWCGTGISVYANSEFDVEKVFNNATLEDDFTDDIILVTLTRDATFKFKEYTISDFPDIQLANVAEMTELTSDRVKKQIKDISLGKNDYIDRDRIDPNIFRRILKLELAEKSKENVLRSINLLEKRNDVLSASPNYIGEYLTNTPNDPLYTQGNQWAIDKIELPQAWNIATGSSNVLVGIVDSGIDRDHPDLQNRINQQLSGDFSSTNNPWYHEAGNAHGTHVAGIVGAQANNSIGITGVCWNIRLVSLKVGDSAPTAAAVTAAIIHATNNNIDILNLSLSVNETTAMNNAINTYQGLLVCAAGNNGNNIVGYPARLNHNRIISVGSSTFNDACSSFSSRHATQVDIFAPGGDSTVSGGIISTWPTNLSSNSGNGYHSISGTSMAAPYVAGVAALLLSYNPNLTTAQLRAAILDNVTPVAALNGICVTGGRLNAYNAIRSVSTTQVFSNFGYNGSTYYWNGKVDMTVARGDRFYINTSGIMVFTGSTNLDFVLSTVSSRNAWSIINGTIDFELTNSDGEIFQIEGNDKHESTLRVNLVNNVTLGNPSFTISTGSLSNDTYTLTLYSEIKRASWTSTKTETFTFIVDKPQACVAEGSMITLADGSQKPVEELTMDDMLLVWNHHTGDFDVAPMVFIDSDPIDEYEIIHLYFSDGTDVKVIYEHAFWNATLNRYVFIRDGESTQYIGDWFNKQTYDSDCNMIWENVQLVDVQIYTEQTTAWSPVTFSHLNFYVSGMLSMPGATTGLINIFEVEADTMQYDMVAYLADIEEYGLFTYEEFAEIIPVPEIIFEAFNGQYLKVSIGKGLIDMDGLIALIERYADFFTEEDDNTPDVQDDQHGHGNHNGQGNGNHHGHNNGNGNHNGHSNGNGNHNGHRRRGR